MNYLGRSDTEFAVVLDTTTTNSNGAFKVSLKAPQDWGGLHDIYAVINGVEEAHGGFITLRTVTVTPRSGPVGTPITITYSGLGDSLVHRRGIAVVGQPLRGRADGQLDPGRSSSDHPGRRAGG